MFGFVFDALEYLPSAVCICQHKNSEGKILKTSSSREKKRTSNHIYSTQFEFSIAMTISSHFYMTHQRNSKAPTSSQKSRQQIFFCFSHGWITFHLYRHYSVWWVHASIICVFCVWHCVDFSWKCGQKNMWNQPIPPFISVRFYHIWKQCFSVRFSLLWMAAFDFFFSVCTDKSEITQDCPHTIGAATSVFILFLTFSAHLIHSSHMRMSSVCRWQTLNIILSLPRSPFSPRFHLCLSSCLACSLWPHSHTLPTWDSHVCVSSAVCHVW